MKNYPESMNTPAMIDHGLSERHLNLIRDLIREFAPDVESVSLFGSRATNSHKNYSDIDMVLYGEGWMNALDARNKMSHIYDFREFEIVLEKIRSSYLHCLGELHEKLSREYEHPSDD